MSLFKELKRRNVFRVAAAYAVTAWLLVEIGATLEPALHLPEWVDSLLAFFLILGFPVALFFSWAYEITPEGLKREAELDPKRETRSVTSRRLDRIIVVVMALALGYFAMDKWVLQTAPGTETGTPVTVDAGDAVPATGNPETVINIDGRPVSSLSIAVLPFVNMSADPEQEYFSDGLTEELLNLLAKVDDLKVAARTSSFFYKDKLDEIPLTQIASDLSVAHVLEGSVRKGGDKIRITAQLIKADDGFHLWSATWDRDLDDVFAIQDEIAAKVVEGLKIVMLGEDTPHSNVVDTESYELALRGRYHFQRRHPGDVELALEYFENAVELDPDNAIAWVGLVPLYLWLFDPPEREKALQAAETAAALAPDNVEAHLRHAMVLRWYSRAEAAEVEWDKAKALDPNNPLLLSMEAGMALNRDRDASRAADLQRRAVEADPMYVVNHNNLVSYLELAGRFEEALDASKRTVEIVPGEYGALGDQARLLVWLGRPQEALEILETMPDGQEKSFGLAIALFSVGDQEASDAAVAEFQLNYRDGPGTGNNYYLDMASLHAWRGEIDDAFGYLQNPELLRTTAWADYWWTLIPSYAGLKADPRWSETTQLWFRDDDQEE